MILRCPNLHVFFLAGASLRPDAPKRESSVEMFTERMRHRFFVRLLRHNKRTPVMAYRTIDATSTWTSGITFALLWKC